MESSEITETESTAMAKKQVSPYIQALVILLPSILALVASSATNVCQPNIAGYFGATQYEANSVITSYIIANGIMLPTTGYLAKLFGKKQFFLYCIIVFCIGAGLCLLAKDLHMLIMARIFQGIGGGCILPLCQAMLLDIFPDKKGFAMALYGVAAMFAPLAGPFFGGYLTDNWSWQWVFIVNIPLCLISIALIKFLIPKDEPVKEKYNKKFDIIGFAGIAIAMGCMQIVLDKGEQFNWFDTPWICWLTGISIFSFVFTSLSKVLLICFPVISSWNRIRGCEWAASLVNIRLPLSSLVKSTFLSTRSRMILLELRIIRSTARALFS